MLRLGRRWAALFQPAKLGAEALKALTGQMDR
jgi:hypothetical protein